MLNEVTIMGRLCHTPEVKESQSGVKVGRLRVACDRDVVASDGVKTDFFDVTCFKKTAEFAEKYLAKGRLAIFVGRLQTREYTDRDGNKRTGWQITADHIYFGDTAPKEEKAPPEPFLTEPPRDIPESTKAYGKHIEESLKHPIQPVEVNDDDLPF